MAGSFIDWKNNYEQRAIRNNEIFPTCVNPDKILLESVKMFEIPVKLDEWMRGTVGSVLYMEPAGRCCLGFACNAAGISDEQMKHTGSPDCLKYDLMDMIKNSPLNFLFGYNYSRSKACQQLIDINDSENITDEERMIWLNNIMEKHDCKFVFV